MNSDELANLKASEERNRAACWNPTARWRVIQETLAWAVSQLAAGRQRPPNSRHSPRRPSRLPAARCLRQAGESPGVAWERAFVRAVVGAQTDSNAFADFVGRFRTSPAESFVTPHDAPHALVVELPPDGEAIQVARQCSLGSGHGAPGGSPAQAGLPPTDFERSSK